MVALAASCATLLDADGDYHEVAGTGGTATTSTTTAGGGGTAGSGLGGEAGAGGGAAGGAGGGGGGGPILWHSWMAASDSLGVRITAGGFTADIDLYRSASLTDLSIDGLFDEFHAPHHPDDFNHVESYWARDSNPSAYPYGGKSTVQRGDDTGETGAPAPLGVFDFQIHPPNTSRLAVMAFIAPVAGQVRASDLAVRRVHDQGGDASLHLHFPCSGAALESLQATNDRAWVVSTQTHDLGFLAAGDRVCFGVSRDDNYNYDAVEIAWTLATQP